VWLEWLSREHDNFRSALSWALGPEDAEQEGRAEPGLRLAVALGRGRFWVAYGMSEGLGWLEKALAASSGTARPSLRAMALNEAGLIVLWQGDYEIAMTLLEEGLTLFKDLGDRAGMANSLFHLGHVAIHQGYSARVEAVRHEAEELRREPLDRRALAYLLIFLALAALDEGDYDLVEALYEESMALTWELGDKRGIAMCLTILMMTALEQGDHERAAALLEEDLRAIEYALSKASPQTARSKDDKPHLSERELEILRLVAEGLTDSRVAQRLYVSPRTVGQHLRSIYRKLGIPTRAAATKEAVERNLI
jgi:ATP/maltotriose-dependent transcriptional regulator MalT